LAVLAIISTGLSGCNTPQQTLTAAAVGGTMLGGLSNSQEIEQVYYLGAFDPLGQLPPSIYRVRVRGQASFISTVKFASGWVHSSLIDSLGTGFSFGEDGNLQVTKTEGVGDSNEGLVTGRKLVQFGPEGFREAPKDHRLVVVMGSDPSAFFNAVDQTLGEVSTAIADQRNSKLKQELFTTLALLKGHQERINDLGKDVALQFGR
jgi:hypothetical protein